MGVGFVLLGQLKLPPVLLGAALFLVGALLLGQGVLASTPPRRGLLGKACLGFGCAGLALSVLMAAVAPFTGQRSQTLGLLTGGVGCAAAAILIGAGTLTLRRSEPDPQ
jgi:hypothetical protein